MDRQQAHQLLDQLGPAQFTAVAQLLEVMAVEPEPNYPPVREADKNRLELSLHCRQVLGAEHILGTQLVTRRSRATGVVP